MSNTEPSQENDLSLQHEMREAMDGWEAELRTLLPTLPEQFDVEITEEHTGEPQLSNDEVSWNYAVGGATHTPTKMALSIDHRIKVSKDELFEELRETYYHEGYHLARGFSFESKGLGLLDVALEEGLATKFEMTRAGADPQYGQYKDHETMLNMLGEVVEADKDGEEKDWPRWKFYDPETDRHWILYRVGTFLVDDILASHPEISMEELAAMPRKEIFALSSLLPAESK